VKLRFWLGAHDIAWSLRLSRSVCMWLLIRASNATDWGTFEEYGEEP